MVPFRATVVETWADVVPPPAPSLEAVTVRPATSALLLLDMQRSNCSDERRPRCVATLPAVRQLLQAARRAGVAVVYSLTRGATRADIRPEVAPRDEEPAVASSVDKFYDTELEELLRARRVETVILVGTSAHGAVLHTATGAAMRGLSVVVPVDGLSADGPLDGGNYPEQYTAWHLVNAPGTRGKVTLTRCDEITFLEPPR